MLPTKVIFSLFTSELENSHFDTFFVNFVSKLKFSCLFTDDK